ncbi:MAG: hypothetical protein NVS1B10_07740 [Candidatus Saccharimonadales bacterium]
MFLSLKSNKKASSRRQINIKALQDDILVLPDEQYRIVLKVSAINFELKSEAEQDALLDTYQKFLNSLVSPIQIIIRVRELDIDKYLSDFRHRIKNGEDRVLHEQVQNYAKFISSLVIANKILDRQFYIVLPYNNLKKHDFAYIKEQLVTNLDIVALGLNRLGIQARQLNSIEVMELFYGFYCPEQSRIQTFSLKTLRLLQEANL